MLSTSQITELRSKYGINPLSTPTPSSQAEPKSFTGTAVDFVRGAGKELLNSAIGTSNLLLKGGQAVMAGLDPTQTFSDYQQAVPEAFRPEKQAEIQRMLEAENSAEKAGQLTAFVASLITPAGASGAGRKIIGKAVEKGAGLVDNAASLTQKAVNKASDMVTPLESGVESVLDPTRLIPKDKLANVPIENIVAQSEIKSAKLDRYAKQAEKAVSDYSQPTPLTLASKKADEALNVLNNKLSKQGQLKSEALKEVGEKVVDNLPSFRTGLRDSLREKVGINLNRETGEIENATGRISKISLDPADNEMIRKVVGLFDSIGSKPTVKQLDDAIDAVQDILYKRSTNTAVPVNGTVEGVLKRYTGELNAAVKKVAGEQYTKANDKFAYFIDARDKLNKALGAEGVRGASLMKQLFGPSGEAPRRLFEEIKKLTGIDLVEEATLAKFVMENVGDARQASLLEEVIRGGSVDPKSFVGLAADKIIKKLQDPIGKAKRVINKAKD